MSIAVSPASQLSRLAPTIALVWFALAVVLGATGRLLTLPFPAPQILILALTLATLVVGFRVERVRAWIDAVPVRGLVAAHGLRFIPGIWFLVLAGQGTLSPLFAERAGWGDMVVAIAAVALVLSGAPTQSTRGGLYRLWNVVGLLDLLVAVGTAAWVGSQRLVPGVEPLLRLPLSLVPTFFVPLFLASHVFLLRRLRAS